MRRTFTYPVYFAFRPTSYYVVGGRNARAAIWRAKRSVRAFCIKPPRPMRVAKVERLYRHGAQCRQLSIREG